MTRRLEQSNDQTRDGHRHSGKLRENRHETPAGKHKYLTIQVILAPGTAAGWHGTVASLGNAVADAAGVRVRDLPLTRERVTQAIEES
jgi:hypothetical protein